MLVDKQMKNKPIDKGFKFYPLACSKSNYVLAIVADNMDRGITPPVNAMRTVFEKLCNICNLKRGCIIVADNYYSTPVLLNYLFQLGYYFLGTLRSNRSPNEINIQSIDEYTYSITEQIIDEQCVKVLDLPFKSSSQDQYTVFRCLDINKFHLLTNHPLLINDSVCLHKAKVSNVQTMRFGLTSSD